MIEDDSHEEVQVTLTKAQVARLFDKARMSRAGWEDMAAEDSKRTGIPPEHQHHTANQAAEWRRIEEILGAAIGGNPGLKKQKKIAGIRRL